MTLWKLSSGTASVIGKRRIKSQALPQTGYILLGENCLNNCLFCAQSRSSGARSDLLSRMTWPSFAADEAAAGISLACSQGMLKRVCLQVVNSEDSREVTLDALRKLTADSPKPVCVSKHIETVGQAEEIFAAGAERICIAIDAATPTICRLVKGEDWERRVLLLKDCARAFPGLVTTHLIVGLGETEEEAVNFIADCLGLGIIVGLFAFTPVPGTVLADGKPPSAARYRRVQIAHYLLRKGWCRSAIRFAGGRIASFEVPDLAGLLRDGKAFETTGCPDCNRPFYNERPGGIMYNYPRPLTGKEVEQAVRESGLGGEPYDLACS
ncbi:MAG TPA: radical SAM protein [Selenomonadales bacterium]|nr:radical SAM protein [Selenomonadales bacterium]